MQNVLINLQDIYLIIIEQKWKLELKNTVRFL